jgi:SWI/SNF-related matrix-associated actin-dependent regulator 1 of chromatin subfamily A
MTRKTPKPHQLEAVDFAAANDGRILISDPVGMGKTLSCILYMEKLDQWPVLIVSPPSVLGAWKREFESELNRKAVIIRGKTLCEGELQHDAVIINYDILDAQREWLIEQSFAFIIFDECDKLANRETRWTKAAMAIAKRCPRVMGLSGTPIANKPSCFFPMLNMIRPDLFPSFRDYMWRYCDPQYDPRFGWSYQGATNLQELHERIKPFMLKRDKAILNLPQQKVKIDFVELDHKEKYDILHSQYVGAVRGANFYKNKGIDKLTLLTKLLMLVSRLKARGVVMWIRKFFAENPNEKLIVFCTHTQMIDVVKRRAIDEDEVVVIQGDVPAAKRTIAVDNFQNDPKKRLAVINIAAGAAGITLTAAKTIAVAELPWTSRAVVQLSGRTDRIGQTRDNDVIFLLTENTIEEKLCKTIQAKAGIHDQVINGTKTNSLPLHKMLEQMIKENK